MQRPLSHDDRRNLLARYRKLLAHYERVPAHRREDEAADVTAADLRAYIAELEAGIEHGGAGEDSYV